MKKLSRYIILIAALILFVGLAPRFLILDTTQETITDQLSKKLGSPVTVQKMQWSWLPLPHMSFSNTRIIKTLKINLNYWHVTLLKAASHYRPSQSG